MILAFGFWDIIKVPFGYVLEWLYNWTADYGLALILFSLVLKLILFPTSAKRKKSMMKMSRISPQMKLLELKYGDDKEAYQAAVQKLYKDEGVSMGGGCIWTLIPMVIIIPLYQIIRAPIQYLLHVSSENASVIVEKMQEAAPALFEGVNQYYYELVAAGHVSEFANEIADWTAGAVQGLESLNFTFIGINLAQIPNWKIWTYDSFGWGVIGLLLLPLIAAGLQALQMLVSQKMNNKVATNAQGEKDEAAAAMANQTNRTMMLTMPIMSLVFCFSMPAAIAVYWIAQSAFGMITDFFLTLHYRKVYEQEDELKRERAAKEALIEAEKERQRQLYREKHPEAAYENVSKKKQQQRQKEEAEAAAKAYAKKKAEEAGLVFEEDEAEAKSDSAVGDRPYARGRAYKADRYHK